MTDTDVGMEVIITVDGMLTGALQSTERKGALGFKLHLVSQNHGVTGRALMPTSHFTDGKTEAREGSESFTDWAELGPPLCIFFPGPFVFTTKNTGHSLSLTLNSRKRVGGQSLMTIDTCWPPVSWTRD